MHIAGRNTKTTIEQRLEIGARVAEILVSEPGLGHRKWRHVAEASFNLHYTPAVAARLRRCYAEWRANGRGAFTLAGSGGVTGGIAPGGRKIAQRSRCRRSGNEPRSRKMACLWFELLQWFVDEVELLKSRADSALLLKRARFIRDQLLSQGHPASRMPKINRDFLRRWRLEYGLSIRTTTVRMKVSLSKARSRIKVMLSNIFRLRHHWKRCFGTRRMRWISFDQKPSWFNNAGLRPLIARKGARKIGAKEDHHGTRQRYTVMTTVQSWPRPVDADPPKIALLFKADNGIRRLARLYFLQIHTCRLSPLLCVASVSHH